MENKKQCKYNYKIPIFDSVKREIMAELNKILLVGELYGVGAPGLVAENICFGLSKYAKSIDVLTADYSPRKYEPNGEIYEYKIPFRKYIRKYISHIFYNVKYYFWKNAFQIIDFSQYDLIFLLVSMTYDLPLNVSALNFKDKRPVILAYFVDAIPPPSPYFEGERQRSRITKYVNLKLKNVDKIYSTSKEMSDFQASIIKEKSIEFSELFNPSAISELISFNTSKKNRSFVYAGSVYYPRNLNYILDALAIVNKKYSDVKLIFVGADVAKLPQSKLKALSNNVEILPYTQDLVPIYEKSIALLDINCDVKKDIYMSSKLTSYFPFCKPIICESTFGSPARRVFANLETVIHCGHNAKELANAMLKVIETEKSWDYSERESILKDLSISSVTKKIIDDYKMFSIQ